MTRRSKTYPFGRVCEEDGCTTRLSVYNRDHLCATCDEVERIEKFDDIARQQVAGYADSWFFGVTEAARVGCEDAVALGEGRDLMPPHMGGLREAVQEQDGFAVRGAGLE